MAVGGKVYRTKFYIKKIIVNVLTFLYFARSSQCSFQLKSFSPGILPANAFDGNQKTFG